MATPPAGLARVLASCGLLVTLGCYQWQAAPTAPWAEADTDLTLRVTPVRGPRMTLFHARVTADSVMGTLAEAQQPRVALALSQVSAIERRGVSGAATSGLVVFAGLALFLGYVFYTKRL